MSRTSTFRASVTLLAALVAGSAAAHPSRGIAVAPDGRVYFSDLERIWTIEPSGRLRLVRNQPGIHTHALAMSATGDLFGEMSQYSPRDQRYRESIWKITPTGRFSFAYGPTGRLSRGAGLIRDAHGCTYHSDQTGPGGRPLVHRLCPGGPAQRLVGSVADDRDFRPVLINDIAGTALGPDGSFYFRQGSTVRKVASNGRVSLIADRLATENFGIAVDRSGALFVAEFDRRRVLKISASGRRSIAATASAPWGPTGVFARDGTLYVLDATEYRRGTPNRMRVRRIAPTSTSRILATVTIPAG